MNRNLLTLLAVLSLSQAAAGCAHMDSAGEPTYADDAKKDYDEGEQAMKAGRYLDALKYFEHVRNKFPYSQQAALADLAIADTNFEREKYLEAIDGYKSFIKLHPSHPKADYAEYRIALSYYKDIPSDFFLFPPSSEKDQTAVRDAREALEGFLRTNAASSYAPEAQQLLKDVKWRLAKHEMYVADFYLHRKKWNAAIGRLNRVVADFPDSGLGAEALIKLARSHLELKEQAEAKAALEKLLQDYPKDPHRAEAERLLKSTS